MTRPKAAFFNTRTPAFPDAGMIDKVYAWGRRERIAELADMHPVVIDADNFERHGEAMSQLEAIFTTWGMPVLSASQLDRLPRLRAVFYAAGSVKGFAPPLLERGVTVVSAWVANAVCVAEFCLAQVLLSCKGYFANTRQYRSKEMYGKAARGHGAFGQTIALLGAGQVARQLIELLRPFALKVVVVDPYLSDAEARALGVTAVSLEQAFADAYVVSNHLPNLPELRGVLDEPLFERMPPGATFINTGRGAQVHEPGLIAVLRRRPDLTALLDVTDPEPCPSDSEWFTLPNVQLSTHLAGAHDHELVRMADLVIEEFTRWQRGEPLRYQVTAPMLARMA